MVAEEKMVPGLLCGSLIAPCGMNCGLCIGYLRKKRHCPGCNEDGPTKAGHCVECIIKNCDRRTGDFCFSCVKYPCARLRQLDRRYRTKYGMSMLENLGCIQESGLDRFLALERARWECAGCGGVVSVHRDNCIYCGHPKEQAARV